MKIPVVIEKCADYSPDNVRGALQRCLAPLGGMRAFVKKGDRVLLKPNLLIGKSPETAVTTHPEMIRSVAFQVMAAGGTVHLGDSPAVGSLTGVLKKTGILPVVHELGIQTVPFRTPVPVEVPEGGVYRTLLLAEESEGYDLVINLPKFKTHGMMVLTLAVKNMFGTVVGTAKSGWHLQASDPARFADMLLDLWRARPPGLNIMDGVVAMEGKGPGSGDPLNLGLIMASPSALAMDVIGGKVAGLGTERHPIVYRAVLRSLQGSREENIRVMGSRVQEVGKVFVLPDSAARMDLTLPTWLTRNMKKSLNSFPHLDSERCSSCGHCAAICPTNAITLNKGPGRGGTVDRNKCISCFCCLEVCPEKAIDIVPGWLLRILKAINMA